MSVTHPAKFNLPIFRMAAGWVDGARVIVDPFAGVGTVGRIRQWLTVPPAWIMANELETAWASEGLRNGCDAAICGDARYLPLRDESVCCILASPAYGNRMADAAVWADGRRHSTYTSALRETTGDSARWLRPGNAGAMQWPAPAYCGLHRAAWAEAVRVLRPGGRLIVSIADHIRLGVPQGVPQWHASVIEGLGARLVSWREVPDVRRFRFGANAGARLPELVLVFQMPGDGVDWVRPTNPAPCAIAW